MAPLETGVSAGAEVVVLDLDNTLCKLEVDWGEVQERLERLAAAAGGRLSRTWVSGR